MKQKSLTKNFLYNLIYQVTLIFLPIITTPYISRVLGAENIGIYGYTQSISTYFILFGLLGISMYGQREIAYLQKEKEKYSIVFFEILFLKFITLCISTILYYCIFGFKNAYSLYFNLLLLDFVANFFDISWFFQGLEEFKKIVLRNLFIKLLGIISIFVFVKEPEDLNIYILIYGLSNIIGNLTLWLYIPKYIKLINLKKIQPFKHLKPTLMLFIPQIAIQIYTILDKTMIGIIVSNKSDVGYYTQGEKIIKMLATIVISLGTVMIPRIASKFAEGDNESIKKYLQKSFNVTYLLAFPMMFGILLISKQFVPLFFGPGYNKVVIIMNVLSPIILLIGMGHVTGFQYLVSTKRQKEFSISVILGASINFIMNIILIKLYGAIGAAIGTVIAEFTVSLSQLLFVRKELNIKKIIILSKDYIIASLIMCCCCLPILYFIKSNIMHIILCVAVGGLTYLITLILLKNEFIIEILKNIKNKILKKNN